MTTDSATAPAHSIPLLEQLYAGLDHMGPRLIEIRRYLHAHPELSRQEANTAAYIAAFYEGKDCSVRTSVGGHGVVVDISCGTPGPTLALRADFDALPVHEETGLSFASQNPGVMHACGHDGHTAYLMVLADVLIGMKDQLAGSIRILHQPSEESAPSGARAMIEDGCLEGVDNVVGIHVMSTMDLGSICYHAGPVQSGCAGFKVSFKGQGGHGSMPHNANDAIVAACHFVCAAQTIVSRRMNPFDMATLTVGSFDAKGAPNVIKETVTLEGDIRLMDDGIRPVLRREFRRIAEGISATFGVDCDLDYRDEYPVLVNDEAFTAPVVASLKTAAPHIENVTEVLDCGPQTPSEDFAYYAAQKPCCFFYVGCHTPGTPVEPHHSPRFDIDERCLMICAKAMGAVALDYLKSDGAPSSS